ncbi:MAG TPA: hypothetical protein VGE39_14510 [Prosthecobacter sp.]
MSALNTVPPHDMEDTVESERGYFAQRKLLPGFEELEQAVAVCPKVGDRDITQLISDDREGF